MNLDNVVSDTAKVAVAFGGEIAHVVYRPALLTLDNVTALYSSDNQSDDFIQILSDLIVSWDLKSKGKKVPVSKKTLSSLPILFLKQTVATIMGSAGEEGQGEA